METCQDAVFVIQLLEELFIKVTSATVYDANNQGAIFLPKNCQMVQPTKHIIIYLKLVFYSVISNYRTLSKLGLIKKTGTGAVEGSLPSGEELTNVLGVGPALLGYDFEFGLYVGFCMQNPLFDVLLGLAEQFVLGQMKDAFLDVKW